MKYNIRRKRQLEIALQRIPSHPSPNIEFEQYLTPANIAADVLWNAYSLGDVKGKKIVDLGCGTGVFAIGSLLLGAKESIAVDIDEDALETAWLEAQHFKVDDKIKFINSDIRDVSLNADTVIQNPPFGAQKAHRKKSDRIFIQKALEIASTVYSFHMKETEEFVINYFNLLGGHLTHKFYYKFVIPRTYHFHEKEKINIDVIMVRFIK
ncbi:MAG: METTL5 family protein [Methanobacteriaceae archaeon]|nr:METTL5 family protein [Methanobacteriaceae archaeon]